MQSSDTLYCFACDAECAAQLHIDNQPDMHPAGYVFVRRADDLAGAELETLEVAMCKHRWSPGTVTAYNHMLHYVWQLDPVEVRYQQSQLG